MKPNLPLISVIVPTFNSGKKLEPSIKSLLDQTIKEIEIVIINDASTDESKKIINELALRHPRIIPVHCQENIGVHEARLLGLTKSSAPWIGFLDDDDFARPNMFEQLYSSAVANSADIVICGSYRVSSNRRPIQSKIRFKKNECVNDKIFERFCNLEFGTGTLWNKLYRRKLIMQWKDMHFPWRQNINEDMLLNLGCFHQAQKVCLLKERLHEYVFNSKSVTSNIEREKAYVSMLRAFSIAVSYFAPEGNLALGSVIDLYRKQLAWPSYHVDNVNNLDRYKKEISEAIELICKYEPNAIAALASKSNKNLHIDKNILKKLFYTAIKRYLI